VEPGVNLRSGPGSSYKLVRRTTSNEQFAVNGFAHSTSGFVWWRLTNNVWVRDDVVETSGTCAQVPKIGS
jgi:hypothetical protein